MSRAHTIDLGHRRVWLPKGRITYDSNVRQQHAVVADEQHKFVHSLIIVSHLIVYMRMKMNSNVRTRKVVAITSNRYGRRPLSVHARRILSPALSSLFDRV